jgi:asparagine N-glycosylation enzyme membrane subunit Stt3
MNQNTPYGLLALALAVVACSPVIAISWNEFLIIGAIVALLLGPPLYRFIRRVEQFLQREKKNK